MLAAHLQQYIRTPGQQLSKPVTFSAGLKRLFTRRLRKCLKPITVAWLIFASALTVQMSWADSLQAIKDEKLRQCLEKTGKKNNWKTPPEYQELICHNKNITSLEGLESYQNLVKISLHKNKLKHFNSDSFPALRSLNLGRNEIQQIELQSLPSLEELYLFKNKITSLKLVDLPELKKLKANSNKVLHFTYQDLPKLNKIYLFDNEMEDIDIYSLPTMKYMDVRQNPMPDELYERMDKLNGVTILHDGNADDWN